VVPLRHMPPAEVDVIRRFLFQNIKGMDSKSDQRWKRLWAQIWNADQGVGFQIYSAEERSGPFHRRHRVILESLFDAQEMFPSVDALHDWVKLQCWFVHWDAGKPVPRSTAFDRCSEDEIRELNKGFEDLLHKPEVQEAFWPHLSPTLRAEMVETILSGQKEHET
jgi:hypothetical protein